MERGSTMQRKTEHYLIFRVNMDQFSIVDLTKYFHPFKIYGPTHIHYDFHPESIDFHRRNISQTRVQYNLERIKMGYVSLLCNEKEIIIIRKFPWFISFEKEIPSDNE
jgi:hypothetical protein